MEKNYFEYSKDSINKLIKQYEEQGLQKAEMLGVYTDLKGLKPVIEKLYNDRIFFLSFWEDDCPYFGWSWANADEKMKSMATITDSITEKFKEIYALILIGLGETDVV